MIVYNYFRKEQKIYYEKLENGLDVYVIPNKIGKNYHIELVSKFGSNIKKYKSINDHKYHNIPLGLAHFLEHKTFDMEGQDGIALFSENGVYANASTSYTCTKYYLDGKSNIKKNLSDLLTMVCTPYLTDENIQNEMGIITEEINMYEDEVEFVHDYEMRKCLFKNNYNEKIAGTPETIKKINTKILLDVYETFYQPSNMFLVVSGNVTFKKIIDIVKNNTALNKRKSNYPVIYEELREEKNIVSEYKEIKLSVIIPKVKYAFKFDLNDFDIENKILVKVYLSVLFAYLFGEGSNFDEKIMNSQISSSFYYEHMAFQNIYAICLTAESEYADLFINEVDNCLNNINMKEEDFIRIKKVWYSAIIRSIDNIISMAEGLTQDVLQGEEKIDFKDLLDKIDFKTMQKIINKLDFNNKAVVLMLPE